MDLVTSVKTCFHKYADFNGRASRSEFWWFYLFTALILLACYAVQTVLSIMQFAVAGTRASIVFALISGIVSLATFAVAVALAIPLLAVGCRRLHDRDQSGWLQLLLLVPCASVVLIVMWAMEGTSGPNHFGYPPQWAPPALPQ